MKNRFNPYSWEAEIYKTPKEIYAALDSLGIYGKTIDRVTVIGLAGTKAEDTVYQNLLACGIPLSQMKNYKDNALVPCSIIVSEPVVITFEDNSTFEFQLMYGNQMKMSVNKLSTDITDGVNNSNIDANRLFASLKGQKIEELHINQNTRKVYSKYSDSFEYEYSDFIFLFECEENVSFELKGDRGNINYKFSLETTYGQGDETVTYKELFDCFVDNYSTEILWGHDTSSYFWIRPVKKYEFKGYDYDFEYEDDEISIEEGDMETFLYWFLNKYFDREIDYHKKREEGPEFEWYLTDNLYSYDTVRRMITDIQEKVALLAKDYDNPALDGLKKRYSMFYMGYRYKSILDSETDEYEIFYELDVDEEQFIKDNIGVAIDFYNRFCRLLQQMMEHNPDNEFISFMGP